MGRLGQAAELLIGDHFSMSATVDKTGVPMQDVPSNGAESIAVRNVTKPVSLSLLVKYVCWMGFVSSVILVGVEKVEPEPESAGLLDRDVAKDEETTICQDWSVFTLDCPWSSQTYLCW